MAANSTKWEAGKTAAIVVAVVAVIGWVGGNLYWTGYIYGQLDGLETDTPGIRTEIRDTRMEIRDLRTEIQDTREELLTEIRRSNQQILNALANHTHDADGNAVFRSPPVASP